MTIKQFNENDKNSANENIASQASLTEILAKASRMYYQSGETIMDDITFDQKQEELKRLEEMNGFAYHNSPNVNVGADVVAKLEPSVHETPALSLGKVKYADRNDLFEWLGDQPGIVTPKCDGSTVVLTYENGTLFKAVTRGNGIVGNDITHNALNLKGVPKHINYLGHLVVRGEATMTYEEFERVNEEAGGVYANSRNLASATIQILDPNEAKKREVEFHAFKLVTPGPSNDFYKTEASRFNFLKSLGFGVVEFEMVTGLTILRVIEKWKDKIADLSFPTDGLVISYNDQIYAESLGNTHKHPRGSIAMKWSDETQETTVRDIEFSVGKTGVITPVAVFDPVFFESNVSRASLHNLSIAEKMPLTGNELVETCTIGIGSKVMVYMANKIIPQCKSATPGVLRIPDKCPVCGEPTKIRISNAGNADIAVKTLWCENPECPTKKSKKLETFFCKDACYAKGLGPSQIHDLLETKLVDEDPLSFYTLADNNPTMPSVLSSLDGWGKKSWDNLRNAIEQSKEVNLAQFLYALSIPLLGSDLSNKLNRIFEGEINKWMAYVANPNTEFLLSYDGIGEIKADYIVKWCKELIRNPERYEKFKTLVQTMHFTNNIASQLSSNSGNELAGITFVITGNVHIYKNRKEFKDSVIARGGKVAGSVSKNTSYLVNNDINSTSSKNNEAKKLGIPIISEDEFVSKYGK